MKLSDLLHVVLPGDPADAYAAVLNQHGLNPAEPHCIALKINGLPGKVEIRQYGRCLSFAVYGRFASHTGYQSRYGFCLDAGTPALFELVSACAHQCYEAQVSLPFLVGQEHREFGWKEIRQVTCYSDPNQPELIEVRLPQWTGSAMHQALHELGFTAAPNSPHLDTLRREYCWADPARLSLKDCRMLLHPLLAKGTRLMDEDLLIHQLQSCA